MTHFYTIYFGIVACINIILVIVHTGGRIKFTIDKMKELVSTPRDPNESKKWFVTSNIVNELFGIRDHFVTLLTVLMMLFNILFILYPFSITSEISLLNTNTKLNCNYYVTIMEFFFVFSKLCEYGYLSLLVTNLTKNTTFEDEASYWLKRLWILIIFCFILSIILLIFSNHSVFYPITQKCEWKIPVFITSVIVLFDLIISLLLLWRFVTPLYLVARQSHSKLTSLKADPLHRLMWKHIGIVSIMLCATLFTLILRIIIGWGSNPSIGVLSGIDITINNIGTMYLFRETPNFTKYLFVFLECIDPICCCCCDSLTTHLEFEKSVDKYTESISKEMEKRASKSNSINSNNNKNNQHNNKHNKKTSQSQTKMKQNIPISIQKQMSIRTTAALCMLRLKVFFLIFVHFD